MVSEAPVGSYLSTILGTTVGALLRLGYTGDQIHEWVTLAIETHQVLAANPEKALSVIREAFRDQE